MHLVAGHGVGRCSNFRTLVRIYLQSPRADRGCGLGTDVDAGAELVVPALLTVFVLDGSVQLLLFQVFVIIAKQLFQNLLLSKSFLTRLGGLLGLLSGRRDGLVEGAGGAPSLPTAYGVAAPEEIVHVFILSLGLRFGKSLLRITAEGQILEVSDGLLGGRRDEFERDAGRVRPAERQQTRQQPYLERHGDFKAEQNYRPGCAAFLDTATPTTMTANAIKMIHGRGAGCIYKEDALSGGDAGERDLCISECT